MIYLLTWVGRGFWSSRCGPVETRTGARSLPVLSHGLVRPVRARMSILRHKPLMFTRRDTGTFFNTGTIFPFPSSPVRLLCVNVLRCVDYSGFNISLIISMTSFRSCDLYVFKRLKPNDLRSGFSYQSEAVGVPRNT